MLATRERLGADVAAADASIAVRTAHAKAVLMTEAIPSNHDGTGWARSWMARNIAVMATRVGFSLLPTELTARMRRWAIGPPCWINLFPAKARAT